MPQFQSPIQYSDLKDDIEPTEEELNKIASSFERESTFFLLTVLNMFLSLFDDDDEKALEIQKWFFSNFIDDELFELTKQNFHKAHMLMRPAFHRQQVLYLMKVVLREAKGEENPNEDTAAQRRLGRAALIVNNVLFPKELEGKLRYKEEVGEDERIHDELFIQLLFSAELVNPPEVFYSIPRIYEYLNLFKRKANKYCFRNGDSLAKRFECLTSLTPERYLFMMNCVYSYYTHLSFETLLGNVANLNFFKDKFFADTDVTEDEAEAFWLRTATELSSLSQRLQSARNASVMPRYDFRVFRTFPLIYTREQKDIITCLDYSFLREKFPSSIYHILLTMQDKNDVEKFMQNWGHVFEDYVNERLRDVYPPALQQFYCSPRFDSTDELTFDGVIDYGDAIVVLETKGGYLNLAAKYGENLECLLRDIDKKFGREKGIRQLANDLEKVFHTNSQSRQTFSERDNTGKPILKFREVDASRVRSIYPVIVVQEFSLEIGFANRKFRQQFEEAVSKCNIASNLVRPLTLLTVEDVEKLIPYLGPVTFAEILEEYTSGRHEPLFTFQSVLKQYVKSRNIENRKNEWINSRFTSIFEEAKSHFIAARVPSL